MGKNHASQYANFGSLPVYYGFNELLLNLRKVIVFFYLKKDV